MSQSALLYYQLYKVIFKYFLDVIVGTPQSQGGIIKWIVFLNTLEANAEFQFTLRVGGEGRVDLLSMYVQEIVIL